MNTVKCLYCLKTFSTEKQLKGHYGKCINKKKYVESILTKEFLHHNLIELDYTCNHISMVVLAGKNIPTNLIFTYAKKYEIKTKTLKEANNNYITRTKYVETCLYKYNTANTFQLPTTIETIQNKYGEDITNIFQVEEIKNKSRKTCINKYGTPHYIQSPKYEGKRNNGTVSFQHKKIETILTDLEIDFISEYNGKMFLKYNKLKNNLYAPRPDILITEKKIVIEIYGDRWHGNPKIYKECDKIYRWGGEQFVKDIWEFDEERVKQIESFGYTVYIFWGSDIHNNLDSIKNKLIDILK